ncbi:hypothetical protein ABTP21_16445, partial [Acinetobacter baumannii]
MLNVDKAGQIAELQQRAYHIRQHALRMGQVQGQGYSQTTLLFIQDSKKTRNNSSTESIN